MLKFFKTILATSFVISLLASPSKSLAAIPELDKLNQELQMMQEQMKLEDSKAQDSQQNSKKIIKQKAKVEQEIKTLLTQLDSNGEKLQRYNQRITKLKNELSNTAVQLEQMKNRLTDRRKLQDNRVRIMYQNGVVSYLSVLLSSTSFMDFIGRFDSIKTIISQDKMIIENNKADQITIVQSQSKMKEQISEVKDIFSQTQSIMSALRVKEQEKQILISNLDDEQKDMLAITDKQEKKLLALAREVSKLKEKKQKIEDQRLHEKEVPPEASTSNETQLKWPHGKKYPITSAFGYRVHPITGEKESFHKGIDIGAPGGTAILAAESGTVLVARWTSGYGNTVIIDHGNGMWTLYAHIRMNGIKVAENDKVSRGQKIAEVGSTGNSTGNHLHFEVRINEEVQNPLDFI